MDWLISIFNNPYGLLICSGMLLGIIAAYFLARTRGYHEDLVFYVAIICIPCAIIGARAYYIIFDDSGAGYWTIRRILGLEDGGLRGLAIYGGIIGAMLGSIIVWKIFSKKPEPIDRVSFLEMFDLFFIFIILGQAIGRWGNFFNEEAYGNLITDPSKQWFPLAVNIDGKWYQATFFYEFFFNIIGFGIMLMLYMGRRKSFDGFVFSFYGIWYGIVRIVIESLRSDSLMVGSVRVSQIVSALFLIAGVVIIAQHIIRAVNQKKKIFIFVDRQKLCEDYLDYAKSHQSYPKRIYQKKKK